MSTRSILVPALKVSQPIGEFYIGVITSSDVIAISFADIRQIERDLDNYLGIQRRLSQDRVREISEYVNTSDATFPTGIILAVDGSCATWNGARSILTITETEEIPFDRIAKILDGQHRIEGLKALGPGKTFDLNVTIFVNADLADQANVFATVNLAQTKVNKSLVYDLFDYAKSRSPQKTAHDVAVALDRVTDGPFFKRIKRLGVATEGRVEELLTQATVVTSLLDLITDNPMKDREELRSKRRLPLGNEKTLRKIPFRNLFISGKDVAIAKIVSNYFDAVRQRWPEAWDNRVAGNILPRTNGFRALMRVLRPLYVSLSEPEIGREVNVSSFLKALRKVSLTDADFNSGKFLPGTTGESSLAHALLNDLQLAKPRLPN